MKFLLKERIITLNYPLLFFVFIFLINENLRLIIKPLSRIGYTNIFILIFGLIFLILKFNKKNYNKRSLIIVTITSSFLIFTYINVLSSGQNRGTIFFTICSIIIPLLFIPIKINKEELLNSFSRFLNYFNILIFIILLLGILDYLLNSRIQLFLAKTIFQGSSIANSIYYEQFLNQYRYYSILGHPLTTVRYFIYFFIFNGIYNIECKEKLNYFTLSLITFIGAILCGSKSAFIIVIFLILFFLPTKNIKLKLVTFVLTFIILIITLNLSFFEDNLKQRFLDSIKSGDISTGRNQLLIDWYNSDIKRPGLLFGDGTGSSVEIAMSLKSSANNFEYPILMFFYDYGIIFTILIFITLFIYPTIFLLKQRKLLILVYYLSIFTFLNTNNAFANFGSDALAQLCFAIMVVINISAKTKVITGETS
ncbi:hypothetical protein NSQ45_16825 [Caldifermentibacillus hisashii]|uniref:hypothetical protein n=1 Tax=Caldifermentibacillus hisashii TaxID=996558 RepID=UPI0034D42693